MSSPNSRSPVIIWVQTEDEQRSLPSYSSAGASGADVRACLSSPYTLLPGESHCIPTGLYFQIPEGYEIQVRPRSGLARNHSITILNTPGTIDSDYRGELGIIVINHGKEPFIIEPDMRIAQLVVAPVVQASFLRLEEGALSATERGSGGFGHTGFH